MGKGGGGVGLSDRLTEDGGGISHTHMQGFAKTMVSRWSKPTFNKLHINNYSDRVFKINQFGLGN